jgi:hypothetical protein
VTQTATQNWSYCWQLLIRAGMIKRRANAQVVAHFPFSQLRRDTSRRLARLSLSATPSRPTGSTSTVGHALDVQPERIEVTSFTTQKWSCPCEMVIRAKMVPGRAGTDTRVDVHIGLSQLRALDGTPVLEEAWLAARAGQHGYLAGKDAEAVACDALIVPVVTAAPDWEAIAAMITLVLNAWGPDGHGQDEPGSTGTSTDGAPPARPLPPEAWEALQYAMARLAIDLVSAPGALASVLRTG